MADVMRYAVIGDSTFGVAEDTMYVETHDIDLINREQAGEFDDNGADELVEAADVSINVMDLLRIAKSAQALTDVALVPNDRVETRYGDAFSNALSQLMSAVTAVADLKDVQL